MSDGRDMATATKPKTVEFRSVGLNLILVREPTLETRSHTGKLIATPGTGLKYEFQGGLLTAEPGDDVRPTGPRGEEEDKLEWLRRHEQNGIRFIEVEPQAPPPDEELQLIPAMVAKRDTDGLVDLHEAEEQGWARDVVLKSIEAALRALED